MHGQDEWQADAAQEELPQLLADGWFIDMPAMREHFGYGLDCPGDEVFFQYLDGQLLEDLKTQISAFRR